MCVVRVDLYLRIHYSFPRLYPLYSSYFVALYIYGTIYFFIEFAASSLIQYRSLFFVQQSIYVLRNRLYGAS
jgi:hypothetical protein